MAYMFTYTVQHSCQEKMTAKPPRYRQYLTLRQ